jgi:hypothetical protein
MALGATAAVLVALGADESSRTIEARGLKFKAPTAWKSREPETQMRAAQLTIPAAEGDKEPADLSVFVFPGGAGTVKANIDRWQSQFQDENGKAPKIATETRKGKNTDVTFAEVAGRYVAAVRPGSPEKYDKPGYRLLGAIVDTPRASYYLKMIGPDKTVKGARDAFDELIKTIEVEGR